MLRRRLGDAQREIRLAARKIDAPVRDADVDPDRRVSREKPLHELRNEIAAERFTLAPR